MRCPKCGAMMFATVDEVKGPFDDGYLWRHKVCAECGYYHYTVEHPTNEVPEFVLNRNTNI